jgi:hypothetical protein
MAYFNIDNFLSKVANPDGFQRTTQFRCKIPVGAIGGPLVGPTQGTTVGRDIYNSYQTACDWLAEGLLCEETSTPSRAFEPATLSIYGLEEKYPVFTTYTDHECTFMTPLIERGGKHHNDVANIFHEWQNGVQERTDIFGDDASMVTNFPDDYRLTEGMQLDQFSTYNEKRRGAFLGVNVNAQGNVRDVIQDVNRVTRLFNGRQIPTSWTTRQNSDDKDSEPSISYKFFNVFPQTVESSPVAWMGDADYQRVTVSFTYSYWSLAADSTLANQS